MRYRIVEVFLEGKYYPVMLFKELADGVVGKSPRRHSDYFLFGKTLETLTVDDLPEGWKPRGIYRLSEVLTAPDEPYRGAGAIMHEYAERQCSAAPASAEQR